MARAEADLDSARAELYRLPREEFTAARNELAKRLRGDGEKAAADAVKALRKPTAAAWVVNQLSRRARADLERLFEAGDRMRDARDADELREASAAERDAIAKLLRRAGEIAGDLPAAAGERIRETLHAAAADLEVRDRVGRGQLEAEERLVGFGAGALSGAAGAKPPRSRRRGKADEPTAAHRQEERARQREHQAAQRQREQAERRHERAVAAAQDAQAELERAQAELEAARAHERALTDG